MPDPKTKKDVAAEPAPADAAQPAAGAAQPALRGEQAQKTARRALTRDELEALRSKLAKKFH